MEHRLEFTASENPWAPTAVIEQIRTLTGSELTLTGLSEQNGGTSSAAFVRWPDGRDGALTRTTASLAHIHQTAEVLSMARSRGLPVPRYDLVVPLPDDSIFLVQERLPGVQPSRADIGIIDALIDLNEEFADILAGRPDVPRPPAFPAARSVWAATLGRYSERSRRLLDRVVDADGGTLLTMTGDDLVHVDFSIENALVDEHGELTGMVDWNAGVARGDRRFALLRLRTNLIDDYGAPPDVVRHLDAALERIIEPALMRTLWIHWSANRVHHAIRSDLGSDRIESDLAVAESHLS